MQDKEFIQYRYVKPFPFKTFQDQRDFVQNELLSIIIIIFTGNPHFPNCFSYLFFKSVVVDVFPEKRQVFHWPQDKLCKQSLLWYILWEISKYPCPKIFPGIRPFVMSCSSLRIKMERFGIFFLLVFRIGSPALVWLWLLGVAPSGRRFNPDLRVPIWPWSFSVHLIFTLHF